MKEPGSPIVGGAGGALAKRGINEIREALPPGKVPGGFARDFCLIFRDEIAARFLAAPVAGEKPTP